MISKLLRYVVRAIKLLYKIGFLIYLFGYVGLGTALISVFTEHYEISVGAASIGLILWLSSAVIKKYHALWSIILSRRIPTAKGLPSDKISIILSDMWGNGYDFDTVATTITPDKNVVDDKHVYQKLLFGAEIDAEGNYRGRYERHGKVQGAMSSEYLDVRLVYSSTANAENIEFEPKDLITGENLHKEIISDEVRKVIYRIRFPSTLEYGNPFKVQYCFYLPRAMRIEKDADVFALWPFKLGIDQVEIHLLFDWKPQQVVLYQWFDEKLEPVSDSPALEPEDGKFVFHKSINNPRASAYILKYV